MEFGLLLAKNSSVESVHNYQKILPISIDKHNVMYWADALGHILVVVQLISVLFCLC